MHERGVKHSLDLALFKDHQFPMTTPILNSKNGHYYEFVAANTSWSLALQEAAGKSYKGMAGYLVTISSSDEQQFVGTYLNSFGLASPSYFWAGGSDKDSEGIWK